MTKISLSSALQTNLLALQKTTRLQQTASNRLASGLKVNSAIENPNSYYIAKSLTNRAEDLNSLLDAMSRGIQTVKTASTVLETASEILTSAASVAAQALEDNKIPEQSWFEKQAGVAAVVSSLEELKAAVNSGAVGNIVIYGSIEITNETLSLKRGQNLVGTEYYTGFSGEKRFSEIKFTINDGIKRSMFICTENKISDLSIAAGLDNNYADTGLFALGRVEMSNIDADFSGRKMCLYSGGEINLRGHNSLINNSGSDTLRCKESVIEANSSLYTDGQICVMGKFTVEENAAVYAGNITNHYDINCKTVFKENSQLYLRKNDFFHVGTNSVGTSTFSFNKGVKIYTPAGAWESRALRVDLYEFGLPVYVYSLDGIPGFEHITNQSGNFAFLTESNQKSGRDGEVYNALLLQYDALISDGSYQGVNLLKGQNLVINFNENRSSTLEIKGREADSQALGLKTADWRSQQGIADSINEIAKAVSEIKSMVRAFGDYYSVLTTREDFTKNLVNILRDGASQLISADMNQESADMLALQVRQQLAVNSLSLASQASQNVLKLF